MSFFNDTTTVTVQPLYPPRPIQFSILLFFMTISLPCFAFVFYHFLTDRAVYTSLRNHVIFLLLTSNAIQTVTDVPASLGYYYTGIIWPANVQYCLFSVFIDYYLFTICFFLLTWASFERHILIFYAQAYNTHRKRVIGHYLPLGFCWVYPLVYYIVFMFFYPCENYYDISTANCVAPCYLWVSVTMALYEQIAHGIAPMFIILFFNLTLIIRVLQQKQRMGQQIGWAKTRKMALQLLGICGLFFITNAPYFIIQIGRLLGYESFGRSVAGWVYPLSMCMPPLVAFTCLNSLKNVQQKFQRIIRYNHRRAVAPITTTRAQMARPDQF